MGGVAQTGRFREGSYDGQQTPSNALYPFFKAIYDKCGVARPDYPHR